MSNDVPKSGWAPWPVLILSLLVLVAAAWLVIGGAKLVTLGGSWYFLLAGLGLLVSAWLLARHNALGLWLYLVVLAATAIWAVWDAGFQFWPLVSRLVAPAVAGVLVLLCAPALTRGPRLRTGIALSGAAVLVLALIATGYRAFQPVPMVSASTALPNHGTPDASQSDWAYYGRTPNGTRFVPTGQITPANIGQLEVAWSFQHGDRPAEGNYTGSEDQNTPLQVGNTVYTCTINNTVVALDLDSGAERWRYRAEASAPFWQRCRGVSYFESTGEISPALADVLAREAAATTPVPAETPAEAPAEAPVEAPAQPAAAETLCRSRIVTNTVDARLIQLDAETGALCPQFGEGGTVDLRENMGDVLPGFYFQTSAPTVVDGIIIVGGWVVDNVMVNEPSGVVRGFDAETGTLIWAWDLGRPETTRFPPEGESYSRGTPNFWSAPAFDRDLGLIYLPTGNGTPDFFGGHRTPEMEEFTASVVALDYRTGAYRWHFRSVNHDIWDYDIGSQPALYDLPDGNGGTVPALVQVTKRGQIFVLNRETGAPIFEVEEREVPQGAAPGDWTSHTQPYSVGMPAIGVERLTESRMWGATPFDALACRIAFRELRYDGDFTPPSLEGSLQWPGFFGGMNWGSVSIHEPSGYLIVNDNRVAHRVQLMSREATDAAQATGSHTGLSRQIGTPYGADKENFLSPLGIPCQEPPYGTLTAIDLNTQEVVWQIANGTAAENGPFGIRLGMNVPIGMPALGGPVTTASGLLFFGTAMDNVVRAYDLASGEEVWSHRLPVGAQGTPALVTSPETGREYLVISAGGARESARRGDYVIAFALPQ